MLKLLDQKIKNAWYKKYELKPDQVLADFPRQQLPPTVGQGPEILYAVHSQKYRRTTNETRLKSCWWKEQKIERKLWLKWYIGTDHFKGLGLNLFSFLEKILLAFGLSHDDELFFPPSPTLFSINYTLIEFLPDSTRIKTRSCTWTRIRTNSQRHFPVLGSSFFPSQQITAQNWKLNRLYLFKQTLRRAPLWLKHFSH